MLQVPAVHVVELREILVVAGDQADGFYDRVPGPQEDKIPGSGLGGEPPYGRGIVEVLVRASFFPRPRIARSDQPDAVTQEEGGVRPPRGPNCDLPYP